MKSEWKYVVSYKDDYEVLNDHLCTTKKHALNVTSKALRKGYVVTIKKITGE